MAEAEKWQPLLPEPYRTVDGVLREVIDAAYLHTWMKMQERKKADHALQEDTESATTVHPKPCVSIPATLAAAGPVHLIAAVTEGVFVIATGGIPEVAAQVWLWDTSAEEPQQLASLRESLTLCGLACVSLPVSSERAHHFRLVVAAASVPPPEVGTGDAEAATPADDAAQALVIDLAPGAADGAWGFASVELPLAAYAPMGVCLSSDGRYLAAALSSGVSVHALQPPAADSPASGPPPLLPVVPAFVLLLPVPAGRAHMHFVTTPTPRAMGESLRWEACGLIVWTEGGRVMRQVMLPSGAPSRAAAAEGARVTAPPTLNWLLPNVMASCAISSDSVTLPAACTPHDSQISHPALALLVGRSGDRPSRRRSGGMGHKRTR